MEFNRQKISSSLMISTIIFVVIWFNVLYFKNSISSNHQTISEYNLSDEDIAPVIDSAVAGVFYPADIYQKDNNSDGYIEMVSHSLRYCPRIMIEPHIGLRNSEEVALASYKLLASCPIKAKNVFLLAPAHQDIDGIVTTIAKSIKTPLGSIKVNQEIISQLKSEKKIQQKSKVKVFENSLKVQLPFLQKFLKGSQIVPIVYGKIAPEELANILYPYLNNESILIALADLSSYAKDNRTQEIPEKRFSAIHDNCTATGVETVILLAKKKGLVPELIQAKNYKDTPLLQLGAGWSYKEPKKIETLQGIELQYKHIQNFVRHHQKPLLSLVRNSLQEGVHKRYRIKRRSYSDYLFNRGASFISIEQDGKVIGRSGSIRATKALAADIADNVYKILQEIKDFPFDDKKLEISIWLLTDAEEINFVSYEDLLNKITKDEDGLIIRSGKREGFLYPHAWKNVKNKEEFLTDLKVQAGLSPTYWSDDIKIYRFRMVKVQNDIN